MSPLASDKLNRNHFFMRRKRQEILRISQIQTINQSIDRLIGAHHIMVIEHRHIGRVESRIHGTRERIYIFVCWFHMTKHVFSAVERCVYRPARHVQVHAFDNIECIDPRWMQQCCVDSMQPACIVVSFNIVIASVTQCAPL